MPRVSVPGFVGPATPSISRTLNADRTYNLSIQQAGPGGRTSSALVSRPAMVRFSTFSSPIRALFEENGRAFVVGGGHYAEMFADGTFGALHALANDGRPASIVTNGSAGDQNLVISGNLGYVHTLSTDAFAQITDPDFPSPARQCEFFDGYGLVWQGAGSRKFQWSGLEDFSTWNALDVAERSTASDNINGFLRLQRTLLLFGRRTMEPWYDVGSGNTVFAPTGSVLVEQGLYATFTLKLVDNTAYWLGVNTDGQLLVYRLEGMTPKRISTPAVDYSLAQCDTPTDAVAFGFQLQGQYYYALILPRQLDASWVYDIANDAWYQWGHWNPTTAQWEPWRAWMHCNAFEKCLVGDRLTGTIYELRTNVYADDLTDV